LFVDGRLLPNTELGHLEIDGEEAEHRASGARASSGSSTGRRGARPSTSARAYHYAVLAGSLHHRRGRHRELGSLRAAAHRAPRGSSGRNSRTTRALSGAAMAAAALDAH
jgi:hypothetical protein